jgi:transcriptional regulator with XRE-family HTH domain
MTTLIVVDETEDDITTAVLRRLREELGRNNISVNKVAKRMGTNQQRFSRRMTGAVPWPIDELYKFCRAAGANFSYVVTGIREIPTPPTGGGASRYSLLPRMDSNHQPSDYHRPYLWPAEDAFSERDAA